MKPNLRRWSAPARGAAPIGVLDVLTAIAILAALLYAAWKQFPAYGNRASTSATISAPGAKH